MPDYAIEQGLHKLYLSTLSPSDQHFDNHKKFSKQVAHLYSLETSDGLLGFASGSRIVLYEEYGKKINKCGGWLTFVKVDDSYKLIDARFCKSPQCPMCQFRRSIKWRAKFLELLPSIQEQYPTYRWVFLTLTIKNCQLDNLRDTLKLLNTAFNRLTKNVKFPMEGLVKSIEVTRTWDCYDAFTNEYLGRHGSKWVYQYQRKNNTAVRLEPTEEVHPHIHVVGMVKPSYFTGKYYLKHSDWVQMWKQALRIEYEPIVNVKAVKSRKNKSVIATPEEFATNQVDESGMIQAICETLKYTVKEADLISDFCEDEVNSIWLKKLTEQLYKMRKVEYRGTLKVLSKELEEAYNSDNLIDINDDKETTGQKDLQELTFTWYDAISKYVLRQDET